MRKRQAGDSANGKYLEQQNWELIRNVYQTIHASSLNQFTLARIEELWEELHSVCCELDRLPEIPFKQLIEVIEDVGEAHNELRLARFLFDLEEINPVYRLIMRNRAVLRGERILDKVIQIWPINSSS